MRQSFTNMRAAALLALLILRFLPTFCADVPDEPAAIPGYLILHNGSELPAVLAEAFVHMADGPAAKIVYITTENMSAAEADAAILPFKNLKPASVTVLSIGSRKDADGDAAAALLKSATGVWLGSGTAEKMEERISGTPVAAALRALVNREGAIGSGPAAAGLVSSLALRAGDVPAFGSGFGLIPGALIDLHGAKTDDNRRLLAALKVHPECVGFGLESGSALLMHGREMAVAGNVNVCLAASGSRPVREDVLNGPGQADWMALRRSAIARTQTAFPPAIPSAPVLENGTLVIDGGGIPHVALLRFIEAAGGPDALILAVPTAMGDEVPANPGEARMLRAAGAKNVKVFHLENRADAFDEVKIKILREAKGLWFCGGRQWRYVDAYLDSPAEKLMHAILKRGGAIGGSSAGATIQGDYLVRGNPLGNVQMMSEGYERGMGFLKGVAIDQHFIKRNRFADMTALKHAYPQLLGLGLDEGAAIVVTGHVFEVIGEKDACVYDRRDPPPAGQPDYVRLKPGEKYDLKALAKIVVDDTKNAAK